MNKNSMRDVTIYFAHDLLGYTAKELSKIYGIGAPRISAIVSWVRSVDRGERTHSPTKYALMQTKSCYPVRYMEAIKILRDLAKRLDKEIDKTMSPLLSYAPEIHNTSLIDGMYCISDNLESWQEDLYAEVYKFLHRNLAD